MTNHLVKIAGILGLSAVTVAGLSLSASTALAAEDNHGEDVALAADNAANADSGIDEGSTGEGSSALYRYFYRYPGPGYYGYYHPWRGYGYYPGPGYYYRPYRFFNPYHRFYRPPFYYCGPYGCGW